MSDEPCVCGTGFTCMADEHDYEVINGEIVPRCETDWLCLAGAHLRFGECVYVNLPI